MLSAAWPVGYADGSASGELDSVDDMVRESQTDAPPPDLVATYDHNATHRPGGQILLTALIHNEGGPAPKSTLAIHNRSVDGNWSLWTTHAVPQLEPGGHFVINFTVPANQGQHPVRVTADWDDQIAEGNETNNEATITPDRQAWASRNADGVKIDGQRHDGVVVERGTTSLRIRMADGDLPAGSIVSVDRSVLSDTFDAPALLDGTFEWTPDESGTVARVPVDSLRNASRIEWVEFEPRPHVSMFSQGGPATVFLTERPMWISTSFLPNPAADVAGEEPMTGNNSASLRLDLEDGDHQGQRIHLNATWLRNRGVHQPSAFYPDYTPIPARVDRDEWVLDPPHFSTLYVGGMAPFQLVNDQPESKITEEWGKLNDDYREEWGSTYDTTYKKIRGSSADQADESLVMPFVPTETYQAEVYVASPLSSVVPGHADVPFYPLALGNQHERKHSNPADTEAIRGSMGFVISNDATGQPRVRAYSWNLDDPAPVYHLTAPWNDWYKLVIYVGNTDTTFVVNVHTYDINFNSYTTYRLELVSVPNSELPISAIDAVIVATEGQGSHCPGTDDYCTNTARVGVIRLGMGEPNYLSEGFYGKLRWLLSGDASCCTDKLSLNDRVAGSTGRAALDDSVTAARFSAEFVFVYSSAVPETGNGFTFFFYKDTAYAPAGGSHFGFADANTESTIGHRGYGLLFEPTYAWGNVWDGRVSLIKDTPGNVLASATTYNYGEEHEVRVVVDADWILVWVNDALRLSVPFTPDRNYGGMGFSASVAGTALQTIQSLHVSTLDAVAAPAPALPYAPWAPKPHAGDVGVALDGVLLSWAGGDPNGDAVDYSVNLGPVGEEKINVCSLVDVTAVTPSCEVSGLLEGQEYCASVVAAGQPQQLSWCFRANWAPGAPHSPAPASGVLSQPYTLNLTWQGGDPDGQHVTHTVFFGTTNPPLATACANVQDGQGCLAGNLLPETTYYWQVASTDGILATYGPVWTLETEPNQAPSMPSSPEPYDGHQRAHVDAILSWVGGDPNVENPTYVVRFGTSNPPTTILCAASTPTIDLESADEGACVIPTLTGSMAYYWQVVASDTVSSTAGPIWSFRTNTPPSPATDPRPDDGQEPLPLNVEFSWKSGGDADGDPLTYAVFWNTSPTPSYDDPDWKLKCTTTGATPCKVTPQHTTTYHWYVATSDGYATTNSGIWRFRTCEDSSNMMKWPEATVNGKQCDPSLDYYFEYEPYAPSPTSGAENVDPFLSSLTWALGPGMRYTVFFGTTPSPATILCLNASEAQCALPTLAFDETYHWRVEASEYTRTATGASTQYYKDVRVGPEWSFTTSNCALGVCYFEPDVVQRATLAQAGILSARLATIDASFISALQAASDSGIGLPVPHPDQRFDIALRENPIVVNQSIRAPSVHTYEGSVPTDPSARVRVTVDTAAVELHVLVQFGQSSLVIHPGPDGYHVAYYGRDTTATGRGEQADDEEEGYGHTPGNGTNGGQATPSSGADGTVRHVKAIRTAVYYDNGEFDYNDIVSVLNNLDGLFARDVEAGLWVYDIQWISTEDYRREKKCGDGKNWFTGDRSFWHSFVDDRPVDPEGSGGHDKAILFTSHSEEGSEPNRRTAGCGGSDHAWGLFQTANLWNTYLVMAQELGHALGAKHDPDTTVERCARGTPSNECRVEDHYTVMCGKRDGRTSPCDPKTDQFSELSIEEMQNPETGIPDLPYRLSTWSGAATSSDGLTLKKWHVLYDTEPESGMQIEEYRFFKNTGSSKMFFDVMTGAAFETCCPVQVNHDWYSSGGSMSAGAGLGLWNTFTIPQSTADGYPADTTISPTYKLSGDQWRDPNEWPRFEIEVRS